MLMLSRKRREKLILDGRIVVTVISVRGNTVQLGIEAPPEVPVHREEVASRLADDDGRSLTL